jgi:hypothetical protein
VAQAVEPLLCKCKPLSSKPSPTTSGLVSGSMVPLLSGGPTCGWPAVPGESRTPECRQVGKAWWKWPQLLIVSPIVTLPKWLFLATQGRSGFPLFPILLPSSLLPGCFLPFFLFLRGWGAALGFELGASRLPRQVLHHLSPSTSPFFCVGYFHDRGL